MTLIRLFTAMVAARVAGFVNILRPPRRRPGGPGPAESTNQQPAGEDLADSGPSEPPAVRPDGPSRIVEDLHSYRPPVAAGAPRARGQVLMGDGTLVSGTIVAAYSNGYCTLVADVDGRASTVDGGGRQIYTRRADVRMLSTKAGPW